MQETNNKEVKETISIIEQTGKLTKEIVNKVKEVKVENIIEKTGEITKQIVKRSISIKEAFLKGYNK